MVGTIVPMTRIPSSKPEAGRAAGDLHRRMPASYRLDISNRYIETID
jgi:hypothetical protein